MLCSLCQFDNPAQSPRCCACGALLSAHSSQNGAVSSDALPDGTLLAGTYAVEDVLGQGGFGITYRCHDRMLDRAVAIKEFFPSGCRRHNSDVQASRGLSDTDFREARAQFLAEARTLARCHHAGIVGVHAAFEANETAYMVMELLHGKSLAQLLSARGGRMNEAEAVGVIERVGEALQFVHELNLLHRDIKPDNIIVCDDGRVMLIDFGTARETVQGVVQGQTVVVTPGYAPLEQYARQAKRGAFTDVYSLAATLYHLLTGQMPPAASDRAMGVVLRSVREANPQVSLGVARAIEAALQMEIARRPQSVREFLNLINAPAQQSEVESFFLPQPQSVDFERDEGEDEYEVDESNGEIPFVLTPDALRARQQPWQNVMPLANAQPVQLAPPRAFSGASVPPKAPVSHGGLSGGVRVKDSTGKDNSAKSFGWAILACFGFAAIVSLFGSRLTPRSYAPSIISPPVRQSFSFGNNPSTLDASQENRMRKVAEQSWNSLPVFPPTSVQILPHSKNNESKNNLNWRGAVGFSPDGKRLAYVDGQAVLQILSMPDRKIVRSVALDPTHIWAHLMFSPDNQTIAVTERVKVGDQPNYDPVNRVSVWSVRTGKLLGNFATEGKEIIWYTPTVLNNGQLLLRTSSGENTKQSLFLWDAKTGKRSKSSVAPLDNSQWSHSVLSPDGKEFAVGDDKGHLHWLDFKTGDQKAEYTTALTESYYRSQFGVKSAPTDVSPSARLAVRGIDYSLNGFYLASRNDAEIRVFDNQNRSLAALQIDRTTGTWFSISPDGEWVAAHGAFPYGPSGDLLWNVKTGQKIRLESPSHTLLDFGFSLDGGELYGIFSAGDRQFQLVTWRTDTQPPAMFGGADIINLQFPKVEVGPVTPLAQTNNMFALSTGSSIEISPKNGGSLQSLPMENGDLAELGFAPDGRFLAMRKFDGAVQLWDVRDEKMVFQSEISSRARQSDDNPSPRPENLHEVAFSSDNRLWAYARPDGASNVVELRTLEAKPRLLASFPTKEQITALKFSPDNKGLVCGGDKGLLQWFDVEKRLLRNPINNGEPVYDISFGANNLVVMGNAMTQLYKVPANAKNPLQSATKSQVTESFDAGRDAYTPTTISPDGKLMATAQGMGDVQIWDLATNTRLQILQSDLKERALIYGLKFSDDGSQLSAIGQKLKEGRIFVKSWSRPTTR